MARLTWLVTIAAAVALLGGLVGGTMHIIGIEAAGRAAAPSCAALGTYTVGAPYAVGAPATSGPLPMQRMPESAAPTIVVGPFGPRGTLTLTAFSGCGALTLGSFSVRAAPGIGGPLTPRQGAGAAIACPMNAMCYPPAGGIVAVTGTLTQDPRHPNNAAYVSVDAMITTSHVGPMLGRPCIVGKPCPSPSVVTNTVTITDVTGYLQARATDGTHVALSFLPPPTSATSAAPMAIVLDGHRGASGVVVPHKATVMPGVTAVPGTVVPVRPATPCAVCGVR